MSVSILVIIVSCHTNISKKSMYFEIDEMTERLIFFPSMSKHRVKDKLVFCVLSLFRSRAFTIALTTIQSNSSLCNLCIESNCYYQRNYGDFRVASDKIDPTHFLYFLLGDSNDNAALLHYYGQ